MGGLSIMSKIMIQNFSIFYLCKYMYLFFWNLLFLQNIYFSLLYD